MDDRLYKRRKKKGEGRREKGEGRREKGEGKREKGKGKRKKGKGKREKEKGKREKGKGKREKGKGERGKGKGEKHVSRKDAKNAEENQHLVQKHTTVESVITSYIVFLCGLLRVIAYGDIPANPNIPRGNIPA